MSKVKEELAQLIRQQPEDSSREEIVRELAFHVMVQRAQTDERVLTLLPKVYTVDDLIRQVKERCAARAGPTQAEPGGTQIINGSVRTGAIHAPVHRYPIGGDS